MKNVNGLWIPNDEHYLTRWLEEVPTYADDYDEYLFRFVRDLPMRRTAVDVGANVGLWTRKLARLFDYVHAFEPVREVFACLDRNVLDAAGNVTIHPIAVGAAPGHVALRRTSGDTTFKTHIEGAGITSLEPLDAFRFKDVDLIKIDTEGYDSFVLRGAAATIRAWQPLFVFESKPGVSVKRYGVSEATHFALLDEFGYEVIHSERGNYVARAKEKA